MNIKIIGQGYNREDIRSVADTLIAALQNTNYNKFRCAVAFASRAGVAALQEHIAASKDHISEFRVVIGIDQKGTSNTALEALLEWDVPTYIYYSTSPIIFHPKFYLFEGENEGMIIIGSNNLTRNGLAKNVECSIAIEYNNDELEDNNFIEELESYFSGLIDGDENENLKILTQSLIDQLVLTKKVPTEAESRRRYGKEDAGDHEEAEVNINDLFGNSFVQGVPATFVAPSLNPEPEIEEEIDANSIPIQTTPISLNVEGWNYNGNSEVLIAEIGGPGRWTQISFAKSNFENFFELPIAVGTSGQVSLKYIDNLGVVNNQVEQCVSARVKASINFNLEPQRVRECNIGYNRTNRPIVFFIKINSNNFIYHFQTHGSNIYTELEQILAGVNVVAGKLRRTIINIDQLRTQCPSLNL